MSVVSENTAASSAEFLAGGVACSRTSVTARTSPHAVFINSAAWCAIVLLLIAQGILFRRHAVREIAWAYPPDHDQLTYLEESYQTYDEFLHRGVGGLAEGLGLRPGPIRLSPSSATLNVQAALIYWAAGPSRLSALSLNLFYWAVFQLTFVGTVRWLTKRWSAAFLAFGLLLTTLSAFEVPGGLFDFRLDFIASCLIGLVICAVIRSRCFLLWRWSLVAGCAGAILATFRLITVVYLFGALAAYFAFLLLQFWRLQHDVAGRRAVARQVKGLLGGAAVLAAVTGPVLWQRRHAIADYYVREHVTGHDKDLRALVAGNTTWERILSFYPRSLLYDHLGATFVVLSSVVLALSFARRRRGDAADTGSAPLDQKSEFGAIAAFLGACIVVPLVVLSIDVDKSHVVGSIMVPGIVWAVLVLTTALSRAGNAAADRQSRLVLAAFAAAAMAAGLAAQFSQYSRHSPMTKERANVENVLALYEAIASKAQEMNLPAPTIATDCTADYLTAKILTVMTYERHGRLLSAAEVLARLDRYPVDEIHRRIEHGDFVILTEGHESAGAFSAFPFNVQMRQLHEPLLRWCRQHMTELMHLRIFDRDVLVFVRDGHSTSAGDNAKGRRHHATVVSQLTGSHIPASLRRLPGEAKAVPAVKDVR